VRVRVLHTAVFLAAGLACTAPAAQFSLSGRGVELSLEPRTNIPGGAVFRAARMDTDAGGDIVLAEVAGTLRIKDGNIEFSAGSAFINHSSHILLDDGVEARFSTDMDTAAFEYALIRARQGRWREGGIEFTGAVRLVLGAPDSGLLEGTAPVVRYTPEDGILLTGGRVSLTARTSRDTPEHTLTSKTVRIKREDTVFLVLTGGGEIRSGGPEAFSGVFEVFSASFRRSGNAFIFEAATAADLAAAGEHFRVRAPSTEFAGDGSCTFSGGAAPAADGKDALFIPAEAFAGGFHLQAARIVASPGNGGSLPYDFTAHPAAGIFPVLLVQNDAEGVRKMRVETFSVLEKSGSVVSFSHDGDEAADAPIQVSTPEASAFCRNLRLMLNDDMQITDMTATRGGFIETRLRGAAVSIDFFSFEYSPPSGRGTFRGDAEMRFPVVINLAATGKERKATVEAFAAEMESAAWTAEAPHILTLSGGVNVTVLRSVKEAPEVEMQMKSSSARIASTTNGYLFSAPYTLVEWRRGGGSFVLSTGTSETAFDHTLSPLSAEMGGGVELVTADGKLSGDGAEFRGGRWKLFGTERPVRLRRKGVTLESEKVVFNPATGEIIPERGEFRVLRED